MSVDTLPTDTGNTTTSPALFELPGDRRTAEDAAEAALLGSKADALIAFAEEVGIPLEQLRLLVGQIESALDLNGLRQNYATTRRRAAFEAHVDSVSILHAPTKVRKHLVYVPNNEGITSPDGAVMRGERKYIGSVGGFVVAWEYGRQDLREAYSVTRTEQLLYEREVVERTALDQAIKDVKEDTASYKRYVRLQRKDHGLLEQLDTAQARLDAAATAVRRNAHLQPAYITAKAEVDRIQTALDSLMSRDEQAKLEAKQVAALINAEAEIELRDQVRSHKEARVDKKHQAKISKLEARLTAKRARYEDALQARESARLSGDLGAASRADKEVIATRNELKNDYRLSVAIEKARREYELVLEGRAVYNIAKEVVIASAINVSTDNLPVIGRERILTYLSQKRVESQQRLILERRAEAQAALDSATTNEARATATRLMDAYNQALRDLAPITAHHEVAQQRFTERNAAHPRRLAALAMQKYLPR